MQNKKSVRGSKEIKMKRPKLDNNESMQREYPSVGGCDQTRGGTNDRRRLWATPNE